MPALALPLRTDRLVLRAYREADAGAMQRICGQEDVARFLPSDPWTPETAVRHVAERLPRTGLDTEAGALTLVLEFDRTVIGEVLLWLTNREHGLAEIGWVLDPEYGGRGLAAEAARAILRVAFDTYGVHRVVAQMDARNSASARLAERLGMRPEAHHRQDWWSKGEWTDTLIYAMLACDWEELASRGAS